MGYLQSIALMAIMCLGLCQCRPSNSGGKVRVLGPEYLVSKYQHEGFDHHISSFGRVPYGHSIVGNVRVAYPETGCGNNVKVDYDVNSPDPLILLVLRGECSFLEKVQNGQKLKAAIVIIVDTEKENMDYVIPWSESPETLNVHIPSIIVAESSGDKLMKEVRKLSSDRTSNVVVSVSFEIRQETKSSIFYRFDLNDRELYETFFELMTDFKELKEHIILIPIYNIVPKSTYNASNVFCLNDGKYCEARPDGKTVPEADEPIFESIRQLCLSNLANESWWAYSAEFYKNCIKPPVTENGRYILEERLERCSKDILDKLPNEDIEKLRQCTSQIKDRHVQKIDDENKSLRRMLEMNFDLQTVVNSPVKPTLMINGQIVFGRMTGLDVLKEMCASLKIKPNECLKIDRLTDTKYKQLHSFSVLGALWFMFKLILVGLISVGAFYLVYKMKLRKEMEKKLSSEVDSALANYYMQNKANRYEGVQVDEASDNTAPSIEQAEEDDEKGE